MLSMKWFCPNIYKYLPHIWSILKIFLKVQLLPSSLSSPFLSLCFSFCLSLPPSLYSLHSLLTNLFLSLSLSLSLPPLHARGAAAGVDLQRCVMHRNSKGQVSKDMGTRFFSGRLQVLAAMQVINRCRISLVIRWRNGYCCRDEQGTRALRTVWRSGCAQTHLHPENRAGRKTWKDWAFIPRQRVKAEQDGSITGGVNLQDLSPVHGTQWDWCHMKKFSPTKHPGILGDTFLSCSQDFSAYCAGKWYGVGKQKS